jgi:hypothetical protein
MVVLGPRSYFAPESTRPIQLSAADIQDLAAFLGTLTGPVIQPK